MSRGVLENVVAHGGAIGTGSLERASHTGRRWREGLKETPQAPPCLTRYPCGPIAYYEAAELIYAPTRAPTVTWAAVKTTAHPRHTAL